MDTPIAEAIRLNLPRLRAERGLSQSQLSALLRGTGLCTWSPASVALVEIGKQRPDRLNDVAALCQVLEVPVTKLIEGTDIGPGAAGIGDALAGEATSPELSKVGDELVSWDLKRIAKLVDMDEETFNKIMVLAMPDHLSFYHLRDDRAGIDWRKRQEDSPALRARRGHATRHILFQIKGYAAKHDREEIEAKWQQWWEETIVRNHQFDRKALAGEWALQDGTYDTDLDAVLGEEES